MNKHQKKKRENAPIDNALAILLRIEEIELQGEITPKIQELKNQQLEKIWEEFKNINNLELS